MSEIYDGKIYGIFDPLSVDEKKDSIVVRGGTFALTVSRKSGQIISTRVLDDEFLAQGACLPNPYVGVFPADEPGARIEGGLDRPRFGHELACEIRPKLFSDGLTGAYRHDAVDRPAESVEVLTAEPDHVVIRSSGRYGDTPVAWEITYDIDVDGLTKVSVRTSTDESVLLRWSCYNHATIADAPCEFIIPWTDVTLAQVTGFGPRTTEKLAGHDQGDLVLGAHLNPFFHIGNPETGIEFSKQDFTDRYAGYRDSRTTLEDGTEVRFDWVQTQDGRELVAHDSRGSRQHLTQIYRRGGGYEIEEFDIRNTTYPLNPGEDRVREFWFQLTPAKRPRNDLNSTRCVWPGPHQVKMVRWSGLEEPWAPPDDEQVKLWAQLGINLIVGGANYFSGDYRHPLAAQKIKHFLRTAHSHDMKVIPYVTFSDFNFAAPGYQEHAAEWMASLAIEYKCETTLMCFGAEGWREHFEREIDALLDEFDFDGIYIDHWSNTRACNNAKHGCGGYFMRWVVDGYHDIARRARRQVARHTDGKGIMLLNTGGDIFSGVFSWFDLRLIGENVDPRRVPVLTIRSSYDPERQGIHALTYPSRFGLDPSFLNFVVSLGHSARLQVSPERIKQWQDECPGEPWDIYKRYWDIQRFFGVNDARRISCFRSGEVARVSHPEGRVNLFMRDGMALVVIGLLPLIDPEENPEDVDAACETVRSAMEQAGLRPYLVQDVITNLRPMVRPEGAASSVNTVETGVLDGTGEQSGLDDRRIDDALELLDFETLGLDPKGDYVVQDLVKHAYIEFDDVTRIPVTLEGCRPQALLIEPRRKAPRVAHFTGANAIDVSRDGDKMVVTVSSAEGSPVALYMDVGKGGVKPESAGFVAEKLATGMFRVAGKIAQNGQVTLRILGA